MTLFDLRRFVAGMLKPVANRVRLLISRAVINQVDDTTQCQNVQAQLSDTETHDEIEHFQMYGFTSVVPAPAESLYFSVAGVRDSGVVVAVQNRSLRPKGLQAGQSVMYDNAGNTIVFQQNGSIVMTAGNGNGPATVVASKINLGSNMPTDFVALASLVLAQLSAIVTALNALVAAFNTHTHTVAGGVAAPVTVPASSASSPSSVASSVVASN